MNRRAMVAFARAFFALTAFIALFAFFTLFSFNST
jgi:hypothetical protein